MFTKFLSSFVKRLFHIGSPVSLVLVAACAAQPATPTQSYAFWPTYPEEPRILFLAAYSSSADVEPAKSKMDEIIYGKQDAPAVPITHPYGVAMWNGRVYVCDTRSSSIDVLDLRKQHMELMGANDAGKLIKPLAIAISDDGTKYVVDAQLENIAVFDSADRYVRSFGHKNFRPVGIAVHGNLVYVADFMASHIEVFDGSTGNLLKVIGGKGKKHGQMYGTLGVGVDGQGNVYADDIINCRVQKFSPDGKFLGMFGGSGDSPGMFARPKHLCVDNDGVIYVVDAAFQNVQMFDRQFHPLLFFGSAGNHPGGMDMPAGISVHEGDLDIFADRIPQAFQAERLVVVTNQFGDRRVSIYAMGQLKAGHKIEELAGSKDVVPPGTTTQPSTGPGAPLPQKSSP